MKRVKVKHTQKRTSKSAWEMCDKFKLARLQQRVDFQFKDLRCGVALWRAFLGDIVAMQQRIGAGNHHPLAFQRLQLLHRKAEELELEMALQATQ